METQINLTTPGAVKSFAEPNSHFERRIRKSLYFLHMFLGVATSLYFCAMSLTGVSLVFKDELSARLNTPETLKVSSRLAPLSQVIRNVELNYPGQKVSGLIYPLQPENALLVYVLNDEGVYTPVAVNQYEASVIGPAPENQVLKFLQEAHHNLLWGKKGRKINAFCGLILCILALSGLGLFLRGVKYFLHTLKMKWTGHKSVVAWTIHQQIGFFLVPSLLIWGLSGFSFGFRKEFEAALNKVLPVSAVAKGERKKGRKHKLEDAPASAQKSLDNLIPLAMAACPGQSVVRIATAIDGEDIAKIWLADCNSLDKADTTEVDISASRGVITSILRPRERASGDMVLIWLQHLHFGSFGGAISKSIWLLIGLAPLTLAVTGLMMWWRKKFR